MSENLNPKQLLTNTRINTWRACQMKYKFRYIDGLVPPSQSPATAFGSVMHEALERWHLSGNRDWALQVIDNRCEKALFDPLVDEQAILTDRAVARAMLHGYIRQYPTETFKTMFVEVEFRLDIQSPIRRHRHKVFDIAGKVDAVVVEDSLYWLLEHKTTTDVSDRFFRKLAIDPQVTMYVYAVQRTENIPIAGVIYNALRKPSKRVKKGQSIEDYGQEMIEDYENRPEFYFRREYATRNEVELREFESQLWHTANEMKDPQMFVRNAPLACAQYGGCAYMPLCIEPSPEMMATYDRVDDLHPELSAELKGIEPEDTQEEFPW